MVPPAAIVTVAPAERAVVPRMMLAPEPSAPTVRPDRMTLPFEWVIWASAAVPEVATVPESVEPLSVAVPPETVNDGFCSVISRARRSLPKARTCR